MRQGGLVFLAYLSLAVVATWPLARHAGSRVFGFATPELNIWAIGWVLHQLPRDPLRLFDGNAFYPYRNSLAFSEHLFVPALQAAPVAAATGNLVLAHNVAALVALATAGFAMYLLSRELMGDGPASFGAGVFYAFHTWNINELIRLQILSNQWFPLLLLALVRFFRTGSRRWAWAAGLFYLLQSLSGMYWALYAPLVAGAALLLLQLRHRRPTRDLARLALPFLLAAAVTAIFFIPYVQTARELGFHRPEPNPVPLDRYLDVLPGNLLYGRFLESARANENAAHFLGFSTVLLAAIGALTARGRWPGLDRMRPLLLLYVATGLLLSAGPELSVAGLRLGPGPYEALRRFVPGFQNVRYPERFALLVVLGSAPLVAAGLARLRPKLGSAGVLGLAAFVYSEHLAIPLPLVPLPTGNAIPSVYGWLAQQDDVKVVAEVPEATYLMERVGSMPMYFSTVHWKRTIQGFTGYFPPAYSYARCRLFHFPSEESLHFLRHIGVDTVVVRPEMASELPEDSRWTRVGPFAEGHVVLRLNDVQLLPEAPPEPQVGDLVELPREGWAITASIPGARRAIDNDLRTAWTTGEEPRPWDFIRVVLPHPMQIGRVSIAVGPPYEFPTGGIRVIGERSSGQPIELPLDEAAAYDRLLAGLLHQPLRAALDLNLEPACIRAIRLRVRDVDTFNLPWRIAELRLYGLPAPTCAETS